MERKQKANGKLEVNKNRNQIVPQPQFFPFRNLEASFLEWKTKSKPLQSFPFLDSQLFAEYLNFTTNPSFAFMSQNNYDLSALRFQEALKYSNLIKYIEKYSNNLELEAVLNNVSFAYGIDKEAYKKQVLADKKAIKKPPKNMPIEQYFHQLIKNGAEPNRDAEKKKEKKEPEVIVLDSPEAIEPVKPKPKKTKKALKNSNLDESKEEIEDKKAKVEKKEEKKKVSVGKEQAKVEKVEKNGKTQQKFLDEIYPVKKKVKNNEANGVDVVKNSGTKKRKKSKEEDDKNEEKEKDGEMEIEKETPKKKTKKEQYEGVNEKVVKKKREAGEKPKKKSPVEKNGVKEQKETKEIKEEKGKKKTKKTPKKNPIEVEEKESSEENKEDGAEPNMPLYINNEIDSDDGESFSFFYVNENVYNKTRQYFQKKMKPEEICSCVGGCNDPTICPCARQNFDQNGKSACYTYDTKYQKKRLINQLIKKDTHIFECSSQCACAKSLCFNSCVNEGLTNRPENKDFIVERYDKKYNGQNKALKDFSSKMWGLKARVFIPANTFVLEYCGEIITKHEGDRRGEKYDSINCNYLFDLNKHAEIEKVDDANGKITLNIDGVCETRSIKKLKDITENFPLVIDAFFYGNHSRFVNHSCEPNMVAVAVHTENRNILLPRIIFFALKDIQPGEEMTIDYNCAPLKDLKNTELLVCLCGTQNCRGFVYEEANESDTEHQ